MNRGHHTSYQYRIVNKKEGSDIVGLRPWLDYTMPLLCLLYKGPKGEEQKNKNYLRWVPYLQGRPVPQAGYTMLFARVDVHVHYCIAVVLGKTGLLILDSAHVALLLGPGGDCGCTGQL